MRRRHQSYGGTQKRASKRDPKYHGIEAPEKMQISSSKVMVEEVSQLVKISAGTSPPMTSISIGSYQAE